MTKKLMVFGARRKSIGQAIAKMWVDMYDDPVETVGICDEALKVDVENHDELIEFFQKHQPDRVVVTIGRNTTLDEERGNMEFWLSDHYHVNAVMPMLILEAWMEAGPPEGAHFVALSSNSAAIPRSQSMAYCSSKAALSMAIRCAARDVGKAGIPMAIYAYEPGLVKGTPMSGERGGTRMLGLPQGMSRRTLATQIVLALRFGGAELNGVLQRIDAGEV